MCCASLLETVTEVLNAHLFESIAELRAVTTTWVQIYNCERPHESSAECGPLAFCQGSHQSESLPMQCLIDGEAYEFKQPLTSHDW
jgi:Integrase core domain